MLFGLRLGPFPMAFGATTPRPTVWMRTMLDDPEVRTTAATMFDNPYISQEFKDRILKAFEGTRLYRQEVLGEVLTDVFGALWQAAEVDRWRIPVNRVLSAESPSDVLEMLFGLGSDTLVE